MLKLYSVTMKVPFAFTFQIGLDVENNVNDKYVHDYFVSDMPYEPEIYFFICRALRSGDFAVDVGANIGVFTILMSKLVGSSGRVLAVESDSDNLIRLKDNLRANNITNVTVVEKPMWKSEEEVLFYKNIDNTGCGALWDIKTWHEAVLTIEKSYAPEKMMATTLDSEIKKVGRLPALVKIDVEGADEFVMRGLGPNKPPYVIAELNPFGQKSLGCSDDSMREFMTERGYECFLLHLEDELPALVPRGSKLMHGYNGYIVLNVLFSTLDAVTITHPEVPRIIYPDGSKSLGINQQRVARKA